MITSERMCVSHSLMDICYLFLYMPRSWVLFYFWISLLSYDGDLLYQSKCSSVHYF